MMEDGQSGAAKDAVYEGGVDNTEFLEVEAPSDLMGGYLLSVAVSRDRTVTVQVPGSGVRRGDRFTGAVVGSSSSSSKTAARENKTDNGHNIPVGHWRDGLCDCCVLGAVHPLLWFSCLCGLISSGQVMQRVGLDICARPSRMSQACVTMKCVVIAYFVSLAFIDMIINANSTPEEMVIGDRSYVVKQPNAVAMQFAMFKWLVIGGVGCFTWVTLTRLRYALRRTYAIPGNACGDCVCAWCCTGCVICQLHRHTADHRKYGYSCCTHTGLPAQAPPIDASAGMV